MLFRSLAYIDTANGDLLRLKGSELLGDIGIPASPSTRQGEFRDTVSVLFNVPIGSRYRLNDVVYEVMVLVSPGIFQLEAETDGSIGNISFGFMVPVTNVPGLGTAELQDVLILGEDAETDEEYKARYVSEVSNPAQDGNIAQYVEWANDFSGIGRTKVLPLWAGANSVKQSILDADNGEATTVLIDAYQLYLDPTATPGEGEGQAPIGSIVTVDTATEVSVNTTAVITLASGFNLAQAEAEVEALLIDFYKDTVNYLLDQVTIIETGGVILSANSIVSVQAGILLNGVNADLVLSVEEIPVVGTVSLSV